MPTGFAMIGVTIWLRRSGKPGWFTLIPATVMLTTTLAALGYALVTEYLPQANLALAAMDFLLLVLTLGVVGLAVRRFI